MFGLPPAADCPSTFVLKHIAPTYAHPTVNFVNFIPEEIHVLATRLATYVSSDSTTTKVTNQ